ncbi:MAG: hypothetical protein ABSG84_09705 [Acidobacteriaceae bacterium]|jgi:hypothetical protein
MNTNRSFFGIACRVAAFSFLMAATASLTQAQQPSSLFFGPTTPLFQASGSVPLDLAGTSSSSSSSSDATPSYAKLDLDSAALGSFQPPPRRTYGRPNYSSGNTNPDGSDKYFFLGGFGASVPLGITHKYETESWGLQIGVGRSWSKTLGVDAEFNYDHFGLQGATIANQEYIYNYGCTTLLQEEGECAPVTNLDGNNHVWSFTLNPIFTLPTEGSWGAYAVVGGGYYHKVTNFTEPQVEESIYYGEYEVDANIDHYTSNAVGVNGGFGVTYKFSKFSNERLYLEAKYVLMLNSQRTGYTAQNVATTTYNGYDAYPANSDRTTFLPIKVGIRF